MPAARGQSWHIAPRVRTEGESPLVDAVVLYRVRIDYIQRGAEHARGKHASCASSPETASVLVRSRARDVKAGCAGGRSRHIAPLSCTEGERPLADAVALYSLRTDHNQLGVARTRRKVA